MSADIETQAARRDELGVEATQSCGTEGNAVIQQERPGQAPVFILHRTVGSSDWLLCTPARESTGHVLNDPPVVLATA